MPFGVKYWCYPLIWLQMPVPSGVGPLLTNPRPKGPSLQGDHRKRGHWTASRGGPVLGPPRGRTQTDGIILREHAEFTYAEGPLALVVR